MPEEAAERETAEILRPEEIRWAAGHKENSRVTRPEEIR
jgi:hypothetical protein